MKVAEVKHMVFGECASVASLVTLRMSSKFLTKTVFEGNLFLSFFLYFFLFFSRRARLQVSGERAGGVDERHAQEAGEKVTF